MTSITQKPDIQAFCADKFEVREYLRRPYRIGDFVYATDGKILLKISAAKMAELGLEEIVQGDDDDAENTSVIARGIDRLSALEWHPYIAMADLDLSNIYASQLRCRKCEGTGKATVGKCTACEGEGVFDYHGKSYECQSCDDDGEVSHSVGEGHAEDCKTCKGTGTATTPKIHVVSESWGVDYKYLALANTAIPWGELFTTNDDVQLFRLSTYGLDIYIMGRSL